MSDSLIGRQVHFWASEPFEFGDEDNPNPLTFEVVETDMDARGGWILVNCNFRFQHKNYRLGLLRRRHSTDKDIHVPILQGMRTAVAGYFVSDTHALVHDRSLSFPKIAARIQSLPMNEIVGVIGDAAL